MDIYKGASDLAAGAVKDTFTSVFKSIRGVTAAWLQKTKLLTYGHQNYEDYIYEKVAKYTPLFSTRTVAVDASYINLVITQNPRMGQHRGLLALERELREQKSGGLGYDINSVTNTITNDSLDSILNLAEGEGLAILGQPGAGKTTVFKYVAYLLARGKKIRGRTVLPILLSAKDLASPHETVRNGITEFFQNLGIGDADAVWHLLLKSGQGSVLIDGLDEASENIQAAIVDDLTHLRAFYKKSIFCISTRPYTLRTALTGFTVWEIMPISGDSKKDFINKWFSSEGNSKALSLIAKAEEDPAIWELGSSPLLLSMICALYEKGLEVTTDITVLYLKCLEGIMGSWDDYKGVIRNSPLGSLREIGNRVNFVETTGGELFLQRKIVFRGQDIPEIKPAAEIYRKYVGQTLVDGEALLRSLSQDFGVVVERAASLFSFSHLSFQEYLTAKYFFEKKSGRALLQYSQNLDWHEVFRFYVMIHPEPDVFIRALIGRITFQDVHEIQLLRLILENAGSKIEEYKQLLLANLNQETAMYLYAMRWALAILGVRVYVRGENRANVVFGPTRPEPLMTLTELRSGKLLPVDVTLDQISGSSQPGFLHIDTMPNMLPALLNLRQLLASGSDADNVRNKHRWFFDVLEEKNISGIESIKYYDIESGYPN